MKKIAVVIMLLVLACVCLSGCRIGNREISFDTKQRFDEAIIFISDYEVVRGDIDSWRNFDETDAIQVTIDGITYVTHYNNVILIRYN